MEECKAVVQADVDGRQVRHTNNYGESAYDTLLWMEANAEDWLKWYGSYPPEDEHKAKKEFDKSVKEDEWCKSIGMELGQLLASRGYSRAAFDRQNAANVDIFRL